MFPTARTTSRRRLVAPLVVALLAATPIAAAQADPDTNIQKPGHVNISGSLTPTGGSCSISRPLGDC